jgi:hypothetical protein
VEQMLDCPVPVPFVKNEKQASPECGNLKTKPEWQYLDNVHCQTEKEKFEIYQECVFFASHKCIT